MAAHVSGSVWLSLWANDVRHPGSVPDIGLSSNDTSGNESNATYSFETVSPTTLDPLDDIMAEQRKFIGLPYRLGVYACIGIVQREFLMFDIWFNVAMTVTDTRLIS